MTGCASQKISIPKEDVGGEDVGGEEDRPSNAFLLYGYQ
jgi:hypothetical protein